VALTFCKACHVCTPVTNEEIIFVFCDIGEIIDRRISSSPQQQNGRVAVAVFIYCCQVQRDSAGLAVASL
jgi:hypothetical protein